MKNIINITDSKKISIDAICADLAKLAKATTLLPEQQKCFRLLNKNLKKIELNYRHKLSQASARTSVYGKAAKQMETTLFQANQSLLAALMKWIGRLQKYHDRASKNQWQFRQFLESIRTKANDFTQLIRENDDLTAFSRAFHSDHSVKLLCSALGGIVIPVNQSLDGLSGGSRHKKKGLKSTNGNCAGEIIDWALTYLEQGAPNYPMTANQDAQKYQEAQGEWARREMTDHGKRETFAIPDFAEHFREPLSRYMPLYIVIRSNDADASAHAIGLQMRSDDSLEFAEPNMGHFIFPSLKTFGLWFPAYCYYLKATDFCIDTIHIREFKTTASRNADVIRRTHPFPECMRFYRAATQYDHGARDSAVVDSLLSLLGDIGTRYHYAMVSGSAVAKQVEAILSTLPETLICGLQAKQTLVEALTDPKSLPAEDYAASLAIKAAKKHMNVDHWKQLIEKIQQKTTFVNVSEQRERQEAACKPYHDLRAQLLERKTALDALSPSEPAAPIHPLIALWRQQKLQEIKESVVVDLQRVDELDPNKLWQSYTDLRLGVDANQLMQRFIQSTFAGAPKDATLWPDYFASRYPFDPTASPPFSDEQWQKRQARYNKGQILLSILDELAAEVEIAIADYTASDHPDVDMVFRAKLGALVHQRQVCSDASAKCESYVVGLTGDAPELLSNMDNVMLADEVLSLLPEKRTTRQDGVAVMQVKLRLRATLDQLTADTNTDEFHLKQKIVLLLSSRHNPSILAALIKAGEFAKEQHIDTDERLTAKTDFMLQQLAVVKDAVAASVDATVRGTYSIKQIVNDLNAIIPGLFHANGELCADYQSVVNIQYQRASDLLGFLKQSLSLLDEITDEQIQEFKRYYVIGDANEVVNQFIRWRYPRKLLALKVSAKIQGLIDNIKSASFDVEQVDASWDDCFPGVELTQCRELLLDRTKMKSILAKTLSGQAAALQTPLARFVSDVDALLQRHKNKLYQLISSEKLAMAAEAAANQHQLAAYTEGLLIPHKAQETVERVCVVQHIESLYRQMETATETYPGAGDIYAHQLAVISRLPDAVLACDSLREQAGARGPATRQVSMQVHALLQPLLEVTKENLTSIVDKICVCLLSYRAAVMQDYANQNENDGHTDLIQAVDGKIREVASVYQFIDKLTLAEMKTAHEVLAQKLNAIIPDIIDDEYHLQLDYVDLIEAYLKQLQNLDVVPVSASKADCKRRAPKVEEGNALTAAMKKYMPSLFAHRATSLDTTRAISATTSTAEMSTVRSPSTTGF